MMNIDIMVIAVLIALLAIWLAVLTIILIKKLHQPASERQASGVILSASYGVEGIDTIDVTDILEDLEGQIIVHNHHFDANDLLKGTPKSLYITCVPTYEMVIPEGGKVDLDELMVFSDE